jgi:menaquinone-dependent protoporphyrinogen oxidase
MNTLIAYASGEGQTETIANRIAERLRGRGATATVSNLSGESPSLDGVDQVVVGASIHAGSYQKTAREWARKHHERLNVMPSWFISVSLTEAEPGHHAEIQPLIDKFLDQTGWTPTGVQSWAGALKYSKYNWLIKRIMRRIARGKGDFSDMSRDYDLTDWDAVDAFALNLAAGHAERQATPD